MLISEMLNKYLDETFDVIEEKEVQTLGLAGAKLDVEFCTFVDTEKFLNDVSPNVRMIITNDKIAEKINAFDNYGLIIADSPRNTFFKLHNALITENSYIRETFKSTVGEGSRISKNASIADNNVIIGNNVTIEEYVVIRENTVIGDNCIIRSGCKIGGIDFEFKRENDRIFGVNHYGGVVLGDNVEVQYNSAINRALYPWDDTVIGENTKIDTLVHIAHGAKIGRSCMIVANSGIGGRTIIGNNCWIGLGCTINNGIEIGDNARVNIGAVVTKSVKSGESVTGNFAIEHSKFIDNIKKMTL